MGILVHHGGAQVGPFSFGEARLAIERGELAETDLAWMEGLTSWVPLSSLLTPSGDSLPIQAYSPLHPGFASTTSGYAIASLILGIVSVVMCFSFITGIPGIICGHLSLSEIQRAPHRIQGRGMAVAGLWMNYIATLAVPAFMLLFLGGMMTALFGAMTGAALNPSAAGFKVTYSSTWLDDSRKHAEELAVACRDYAADHQGQYPIVLAELHPKYLADQTKLEDPLQQLPGTPGYTYLMAGRVNPDPNEVLLRSQGKTDSGQKVVAYVNGTTALEESP